MSADTWLEDNNRYLAVSLMWLRARLRSAVSGGAASKTTGSRVPDAGAADRDSAATTNPPPALLLLAQNFGLSDFERDILLLCAAVELAPDIASLLTKRRERGGAAIRPSRSPCKCCPNPAGTRSLRIVPYATCDCSKSTSPARRR